jgi:hypothetical protein
MLYDARLTTVVYGDGAYGSISTFECTDSYGAPKPNGIRTVRPVAAMARVPRAILAKVDANVQATRKTALRVRKQTVEWLGCEEKDKPRFAVLKNGGEKIGRGYGRGLVDSLSLDPAAGMESDGLLATVVQMLGLWHVKASVLSNVSSTDVRIIRTPAAIWICFLCAETGMARRANSEGPGPDWT